MPFSFTACYFIICCPHVSEQIVNLYTDAGCGSIATVGPITYKDFSIPIGCTNTGSDASLTSLTADCNPGQYMYCSLCAVVECRTVPQTLQTCLQHQTFRFPSCFHVRSLPVSVLMHASLTLN